MAQNTADRRRITGPEETSSQVFDDAPDAASWQMGDPRRTRHGKDIRPICAYVPRRYVSLHVNRAS